MPARTTLSAKKRVSESNRYQRDKSTASNIVTMEVITYLTSGERFSRALIGLIKIRIVFAFYLPVLSWISCANFFRQFFYTPCGIMPTEPSKDPAVGCLWVVYVSFLWLVYDLTSPYLAEYVCVLSRNPLSP